MMRIAAAGACVLASASAFAPSGGLPMPVRGNALAASRSTGAPRTGALALKADSEVDPKSLVGKFSRMIENKDLDHLRDGNIRFRQNALAKDPDYFKRMASSQKPQFLWIGCSDARIPANEIIGLDPGEVLVHRNVANQVVNTDASCMSILQFSTEYLEIPNIIVCGHYECGGVNAAMSKNDHHAPLENWIRSIRDVRRLHNEELSKITDMKDRAKRLVELNTLEQAKNVYKEAVVQRRRTYTNIRNGDPTPRIFAMIVDPKTGEIKDLGFDSADYPELDDIYLLYDQDMAQAAYADKDESYRKRPSTFRTRRMYNRMPVTVVEAKKATEAVDTRVSALLARLQTSDGDKDMMKELEEIKSLLKK